MKITMPRCVRLRSDDGCEVTVDLSNAQFSEEQSNIVGKLFLAGDHATLSRDEWEQIKDLKSIIKQPGGESDLIVRFDWTWVRIDEMTKNFDSLTKPGGGGQL
ncbi:hypothetical protein [Muricoccus pecuniae]|uniref:Uncharacterized protein n=1 Tax=Muricoccus pecuniae TaxID=693023 RepID=A0A840Y6V0_9PROT|nr:hypothetical protein [Roseomonas pecuniae]MBB5696465.1 hypothetical protein [Roseomonas pecuniae]